MTEADKGAPRELRIVDMETGEVVKRIDVTGKSERQIERIEMGMLRNMNLERYTVEVSAPSP